MRHWIFEERTFAPRLACTGIFLLHFLLVGCAKMGPRTVPRARFNYNQAIAGSWNEQLLLNLVRLRYRDTPLFLELDSVLTQYEFGGTGSVLPTINAVGDRDELGLGIGVDYTERPTITYTPLQGEEFSRRFLSPISSENIILLSQSGWSIERLLLCCVQQINGVKNAPSASGPTPSYAPPHYREFQKVSRILRELQIAGTLDLQVIYEQERREMFIHIHPPTDVESARKIEEVRRILDLDEEQNVFRMRSGVVREGRDEIAISGRSMLGALFYLSQSVDPPQAHEDQGLVTVTTTAQGERFDWALVIGNLLGIRSQTTRPANAFVRINYRGHWFYIDDADLNSKSTFSLLTYVFSLQAAGEGGVSPLLTVPVR